MNSLVLTVNGNLKNFCNFCLKDSLSTPGGCTRLALHAREEGRGVRQQAPPLRMQRQSDAGGGPAARHLTFSSFYHRKTSRRSHLINYMFIL